MISKNIYGIITALVLAIFTVSLFTGAVVAQTQAEQFEKADKQYRMNKEKLDNTKKQFENARNLFEAANRRFRDVKDNKISNISNEELIGFAREYVLKAINHTEARLEVMENQLENSENKKVIASDAIKIIDDHVAQLEQLKTKVIQATTFQEIREAHNELKNIVVKINLETRYFTGILLNQRINNFITRADNISEKINVSIANLKANGTQTVKLEADAAGFVESLTEAKESKAKADDLFADHSGFSSNGTVTDEKEARAFIEQANKLQKETIKRLKEAGKQLIQFARDIKKTTKGE